MDHEFLSGFRETAIDKLVALKKKIEATTQELETLRKDHDVILKVIVTLNQNIEPDPASKNSTGVEEFTPEECPVVEALVESSATEDCTTGETFTEEPGLYLLPPRERDLLNYIRRKKYLTRNAAVAWYIHQSPGILPHSAASNTRRCITALRDKGLITRTLHGTWRPRKAGD